MLLIKNNTSGTISIEIQNRTSSIELLPIIPGDVDVFDVTDVLHIFSDSGSCIFKNYSMQGSKNYLQTFGKLTIEQGSRKSSGTPYIIVNEQ